ncbi:MAG: nucleotide exchange factor GrpE [Clostridiales bacterium]|jgi:molecular chaperone GrpE (heat shock protein)|nr:nucleotide exchange factor GrpE [Clostridiales bacterium]
MINTNALDNIAGAWQECTSCINGLTRRTVDAMLLRVKYGVMDRVIGMAGRNARLSGYDEKLVGAYGRLIDYYLRAVEILDKRKGDISTVSVRNILRELYDTFLIRVQLFAAHRSDNQVVSERIALQSACVSYFIFSFADTERMFRHSKYNDPNLAECREGYFDAFFDKLLENILELLVEKHYETYAKSVSECVNSLNNIAGRKVLNHYLTQLKYENELKNIINRYAIGLRHELGRAAGNSYEKETTQDILNLVHEAAEFYDSECVELILAIETQTTEPYRPETQEEFAGACREMLSNTRLLIKRDYDETLSNYAEMLKRLQNEVESGASAIVNMCTSQMRDPFIDATRRVLCAAKATIDMAESITINFCRINSLYREQDYSRSSIGSSAKAIMDGINETLYIKAESLNEAIETFGARAKDFSSARLAREANTIEKTQFAQVAFDIIKRMNMLNWERLFELLHDSEPMAAYAKRVGDMAERWVEGAKKEITRFVRDSVLYEVGTFEEILRYSVTRLRESDDDNVKDYVELVDKVTTQMEQLLALDGIEMIRPAPHDMFNGKEHEVIMAEKSGEFAKGEIIKCVTSGYRQGEKILTRANVIAAK